MPEELAVWVRVRRAQDSCYGPWGCLTTGKLTISLLDRARTYIANKAHPGDSWSIWVGKKGEKPYGG